MAASYIKILKSSANFTNVFYESPRMAASVSRALLCLDNLNATDNVVTTNRKMKN